MKRIAIYCASSTAKRDIFETEAKKLTLALIQEGYEIVYGGANVGIMKIIADTALENNGHVIGVLPNVIADMERAHPHLSEMIRVNTMHERKAKLDELSDLFIAFPGGFGTLDEITEAITYHQIGLHRKISIFYNLEGYYDGIKLFIENAIKEGFIPENIFKHVFFLNTPQDVLEIIHKVNKNPKVD